MRLWRMSKSRLATTAVDGEGARLVGGRWNSPGRRAVYLSEHLSLAALEVLAHFSKGTAPEHVAVPLDVPQDLAIHTPPLNELPTDWRAMEAPPSTQRFGDAWFVGATTALLRVPSVIIPEEFNVILNPIHPDFARIKIHPPVPFRFDPRLIKE